MHKTYEGKGVDYRCMRFDLMRSDKRVGLYRQMLLPCKNPENDLEKPIVAGYEVVLLVYSPPAQWGVVKFEGGWNLPTKTTWGTNGWTFASLQKARQKYDAIIRDHEHHFQRIDKSKILN